jgi:hypothetical protein
VSKTKTIIGALTGNKFQLLIAVVNVAVLALGAYITIRLSPIYQDIAVIKTEVQANVDLDKTEHAKIVTKDTFEQLVTRIDHISNRVDSIYSILK